METPRHSDHSGWAGASTLSDGGEAELLAGGGLDRVAAQVELDRALLQARERAGARGWGRLPEAIQAALAAIEEKRRPRVDWRRSLRLFAAGAGRTRIVSTRRRESRRYQRIPGIRVKRERALAVVVDTSGSVSDHELALFFAEIHGIWRSGATVEVIECDARVRRSYPYKGRAPGDIAGRGGTAFDPAFRHLRDQRRVRYDGCVYLTDGCAAAPTVRPPCPLLWGRTSGGRRGDHLKCGRSVQRPEGR